MTDPTGRSFLSYRRTRAAEAALLIEAQHDHGIPTWQDVHNLGPIPTEDEIRRVLSDPSTANAVLFITPEVEVSSIIRNVEVPKIIGRAEASDSFFVVPVAAGGLDYATAAEVTSNCLSAANLTYWNVHRVPGAVVTSADAATVASRVLVERVKAIHAALPPGAPLRLGLFARRPPPFEPGTAFCADWSAHFRDKQASPAAWEDRLLPALARIAAAARQYAPGRAVEAFGLPTLPAATALGCTFSSTSGISVSWRQYSLGQSDQIWTLSAPRTTSGFMARLVSYDASARDIAVLVSVTDEVEPLFASFKKNLPNLRALVHVAKPGPYPHRLAAPGEASDVAMVTHEGLRRARREYGDVGTIHLFQATPAGVAMLIGQLLNTFGLVQTYEHVTIDGSGVYRPAALLRPND
ncbi:MAG: SAVED domain-containing protein [Steroidobacteraceae bacterium]|jgi:hypothetical protein